MKPALNESRAAIGGSVVDNDDLISVWLKVLLDQGFDASRNDVFPIVVQNNERDERSAGAPMRIEGHRPSTATGNYAVRLLRK